jgi:Ca2+-binding EF-hand superfamily protein
MVYVTFNVFVLRSFENIDLDGDGTISEQEFQLGLLGEGHENISTRKVLETLMDEIRCTSNSVYP